MDAEACYDLVHDEQGTVLGGQVAEAEEVVGEFEGKLAEVGAGGLEDDGCDIVVGFEGALDGTEVTGGDYDHGVPCALGNAWGAAVGAGHGVVVPAMEVVLELDNLVLAG